MPKIGCRTVAVSCNRDSEIGKEADLAIEPVPGPEVLTGSTRLKAGTVPEDGSEHRYPQEAWWVSARFTRT